jgi:hypothetical protein
MNKTLVLVIVSATAVAAMWSATGFAAASPSSEPPPGPGNFGGNGSAWVNDFPGHYYNQNNPNVRQDWLCHQRAVPGVGGIHSSEDSATLNWPDGVDGKGTLVVPGDKSNACDWVGEP